MRLSKLKYYKVFIIAAFILGNFICVKAFAQPSAQTLEQYMMWVRNSYLSDQKQNFNTMENTVRSKIGSWDDGREGKNLRGANIVMTQLTGLIDSLELKYAKFPKCNDNRIAVWDIFFDEPDKIPFYCPDDDIGNDENTGQELKLLCKKDSGACGIHFDNKHPGTGGVIGVGIMLIVPVSFGECSAFYITGSYVEYFFPWFLLNGSRQMYQSSYIAKEYVSMIRPINHIFTELFAKFMVMPTISFANIIATTEQAYYGSAGNASLSFSVTNDAVEDGIEAVKDLDDKYKDLSAHSSKGFARNFSSVPDIDMLDDKFKHVPHVAKDTHRFGTDLPMFALPMPIPGSGPSTASKGGIMHSKFLPMSMVMDKKWQKLMQPSPMGGPRTCLRNNKKTGKTPQDLDIRQFQTEDKDDLCLDDIGHRYPLMADSFSLHDTDAFWRAVVMGGLDMFYVLNWEDYFKGGYSKKDAASQAKYYMEPRAPVHTFLESIDRFVVTTMASDSDFKQESPECKTLEEMTKVNVDYKKANIHDPEKGGENTLYIFGLVKGIWGFKGIPPLFGVLTFEQNGKAPKSRAPDVYMRFN